MKLPTFSPFEKKHVLHPSLLLHPATSATLQGEQQRIPPALVAISTVSLHPLHFLLDALAINVTMLVPPTASVPCLNAAKLFKLLPMLVSC